MKIFQNLSPHIHYQFLVYILLLSTSATSVLTYEPLAVRFTKDKRLPRDITDSSLDSKQSVHFITVDPGNEMAADNNTCYPPDGGGNSSISCKSLDYALQAFHSFRSINIYLASPSDTYYLNTILNVTNQYNIGFHGNDSLYPLIPIIKCKQNVGLSFTNSSNISLRNVVFFNCGSIQTSTSKNFSHLQSNTTYFLPIRVGLYFYNCTTIKMYHVQVLNGSQAIGVVMYDTNGVIEVKSSTFANNTVHSDGSQAGGGGFTVEFTYCKLGDVTCDDIEYDSIYKRNRNATYLFDNCTFRDNVAHNLKTNGHYVVPSKSGHDATGRGGGLSIFFRGDAMNNSVRIVDSRFIANYAVWGGGLRIEMTDSTINNTATLLRCEFDQNHIVINPENGRYTGGGGLHIATTTHYQDDAHRDMSKLRSQIHLEDCSFSRKQALEGGAVCITSALQNVISTNQAIEMLIVNSTFEFNQAKLGSAVILTNFPIFNIGVLSHVSFNNCKFLNNVLLDTVAVYNNNLWLETAGMAAVYISEVPVSFHNVTTFYNNTGSALVVVGSQVNFSDSIALFKNNKGSDGGAIALLGATSILIGPNTHMTFVDNTVSRYGGAIYNRYISNEYLESTTDCFFRYTDPFKEPSKWDAHFNFSGNKAAQDGCSIFSTSVYPCLWTERNLPQGSIGSVFQWNDNWKYENSKCKYEIYTEPRYFTFNNWSSSDPITFFPGQTFRLPLDAWDDFNNNVTDDAVYSASVLDSVILSSPVAEVDPGYTYITSNYIRITGEPGNNIKLAMQTEGSQKIHLTFNLTIRTCPPGFVRSQRDDNYHSEDVYNISIADKKMKCECPPDNSTYQGHLKCNSELFKSKVDIRYWYGPVNTKESDGENSTSYLMGTVPFSYRFVSQDMAIDLPENIDEVEEALCGHVNRRGVLCGECVEGYAVAVNSPTYECVPCNNSTTTGEFVKHLFAYIVLTYAPITVVFVLIIFFKIKLASSAAAGFVLYAQTISSGYFDINVFYLGADNHAPQMVLSKYMTHIYGILNLESLAFLMHPFCLNKHFTTLQVLCLDYVTAVFPLVVIVAIYLAYRCKFTLTCKCPCQRRQQTLSAVDLEPTSTTSLQGSSITPSEQSPHNRAPRNTLIHALTAFMLLSYTKFSLASIRTVVIGELFDAEGNTRSHRMYLAGHLSFSDSNFLLPFGILAVLVLVFIVFLPPLLLLGPLQFIDWLVDKPGFSCLRRYWPSITIHTILDTFQGYKPNRRFFGGLYLFFRLIMFLTYSFSQNLLTQYSIQQITILFYAAHVPLLRPYVNDFYNCLDTLLFLNLGILNALATYAFEHRNSTGVYAFESVLVFLPLVYMICYVIWNRLHKMKLYKAVKESFIRHLVNPVRASHTNILRNEQNNYLLKIDDSYPFGESNYYSSDDPDDEMFQRAAKGNLFRAANTHPRRPGGGGVSKTVVGIDTQPSKQTEEKISMQESSVTCDSGIGTQNTCNTRLLDTKNSEC